MQARTRNLSTGEFGQKWTRYFILFFPTRPSDEYDSAPKILASTFGRFCLYRLSKTFWPLAYIKTKISISGYEWKWQYKSIKGKHKNYSWQNKQEKAVFSIEEGVEIIRTFNLEFLRVKMRIGYFNNRLKNRVCQGSRTFFEAVENKMLKIQIIGSLDIRNTNKNLKGMK